DGAARAPRRAGFAGGLAPGRDPASDAPGVAALEERRPPDVTEGRGRALRAPGRDRGEGPGMAGAPGPRAPLPPELSPDAPARPDPRDAARALDPDRGRESLPVRGNGDLRRSRLRLLDHRRSPRAHRLEDGQPRSRGDGRPARLLRAL